MTALQTNKFQRPLVARGRRHCLSNVVRFYPVPTVCCPCGCVLSNRVKSSGPVSDYDRRNQRSGKTAAMVNFVHHMPGSNKIAFYKTLQSFAKEEGQDFFDTEVRAVPDEQLKVVYDRMLAYLVGQLEAFLEKQCGLALGSRVQLNALDVVLLLDDVTKDSAVFVRIVEDHVSMDTATGLVKTPLQDMLRAALVASTKYTITSVEGLTLRMVMAGRGVRYRSTRSVGGNQVVYVEFR